MKYFSIKELTRSDTADRLGIDNSVPKELEGNLVKLIENLLDPIREKWGKPIRVNSGYRCPKLNKAVGGVPTSEHCFDDKTEILTLAGWRNCNTISLEDTLLSYNLEKDIIEETPIMRIVKRHYKGDMFYVKNKNVDVCATDNHRMLIRYASHKYIRKPNNKIITAKGQAYFDSLKTDNDKYHFELFKDIINKRRIFKCSSKKESNISVDMNEMKLALALVADGFWKDKYRDTGFGFRFKKERKIKEIEHLLSINNIPIQKRIDNNNVTNYYIPSRFGKRFRDIIGYDKEIPYYILRLDSKSLLELIKYYAFFDGCLGKGRESNNFSISTTNQHNMNIFTAIAPLCGLRCSVNILDERPYNIKGQTGIAKRAYCMCFSEYEESRVNENYYSKVSYNGNVWCVEGINGTVIIRRNGKTCIQGNCKSMAADVTTGNKADNIKLFNMIKNSKDLKWRQLILEKGGIWIHISYNENDNKKQIIYA